MATFITIDELPQDIGFTAEQLKRCKNWFDEQGHRTSPPLFYHPGWEIVFGEGIEVTEEQKIDLAAINSDLQKEIVPEKWLL